MRIFLLPIVALLFVAPFAHAQELVSDTITTMRAKVVEVVSQETKQVPGLNVSATTQTIKIQILDGAEQGTTVTIANDYLVLKQGEVFYLRHDVNALDGTDYYYVYEPYRLGSLAILGALFIALVLFFGGKQGARGLLALGGSLFFIVFLLLPGILHGYPPVLVAMGVSSLIICLGSYITHGFNRTTSTAVFGMVLTIVITGLLAYAAIPFTRLTGIANEEAVYLNLNAHGSIDLAGLLLGGMLIGVLGVLYDAAIGQAVAVEELTVAAPELSRAHIYKRALRIGREHIGALVNTLAIAYVGAALPLLLLFFGYGTDTWSTAINREIFATEIVRILIGSIGLVLAVPITTFISVRMLVGKVSHSRHSGHHH
ncbi:MAG: hypothetical protein JWM46_359 [Candidatus Kaiserbacteria bacterium]|nr:hypothetical protein [Candidatus Kaiserbacteria bacterium]